MGSRRTRFSGRDAPGFFDELDELAAVAEGVGAFAFEGELADLVPGGVAFVGESLSSIPNMVTLTANLESTGASMNFASLSMTGASRS